MNIALHMNERPQKRGGGVGGMPWTRTRCCQAGARQGPHEGAVTNNGLSSMTSLTDVLFILRCPVHIFLSETYPFTKSKESSYR